MGKYVSDFQKYVSIQLMDYVAEQTGGSYASSGLLKKVRSGIENICISAFGRERILSIRRDSSRILRACLSDQQMGITNKFLKFFDSKNKKKTDVISLIIHEIASNISSGEYRKEQSMIKRSWSEKLKSEQSSQNLEKA